MRGVLFVLIEHGLETGERVFKSALLERDAAELKMSVGLLGVDGDCALELFDCVCILAALLVDESKLIASFGVVGVDGGSFQHAVKVLAAAQTLAQVRNFAAQIAPCVKQE